MADERPTTPDGALPGPDEEPTRVVEPAAPGGGSAAGTPPAPGAASGAAGIEDIDVPVGGRVAEDTTAAPGGGPDAAAVTGGAPRATGPVPPDAAQAGAGARGEDPGVGATSEGDGLRSRAKERTAEGAKLAADRVSQAASATARALRETDVREIAHSTTDLIQTTRPFFLAAFAAVFTFLAAVENHASIGVVFALGAILCVLGAAYSSDIGGALGRRRDRRR